MLDLVSAHRWEEKLFHKYDAVPQKHIRQPCNPLRRGLIPELPLSFFFSLPCTFILATGRLCFDCVSLLLPWINVLSLLLSLSQAVLFAPSTSCKGQRSDPQTVLNAASWCSVLSTGFLLGQCPGMVPMLDLERERMHQSLIKILNFFPPSRVCQWVQRIWSSKRVLLKCAQHERCMETCKCHLL